MPIEAKKKTWLHEGSVEALNVDFAFYFQKKGWVELFVSRKEEGRNCTLSPSESMCAIATGAATTPTHCCHHSHKQGVRYTFRGGHSRRKICQILLMARRPLIERISGGRTPD